MHHFGLWDESVSSKRAAPVSLERLALPFLAFTNPLRRFTMNNFFTEQRHHALPKAAVILTFVMILLFTLVGCGGGSSAIVGRWILEEGQSTFGVSDEMELLKDGTGTFIRSYDERKVFWKTDNNRVYFTTALSEFAYDYKISGSTLTLKDDSRMITYRKATRQEDKQKRDKEKQVVELEQKLDQAQLPVEQLVERLREYNVDTGTYPTTEQGGLQCLITRPNKMTGNDVTAHRINLAVEKWKGPYLKVLPTDPWGNKYYYEYPTTKTADNTPAIWSSGPDKISGNNDDIRNWNPADAEITRARQAEFMRTQQGSAMSRGMSGMDGGMSMQNFNRAPVADEYNAAQIKALKERTPVSEMAIPNGMPGTGPPMSPSPGL